jgi:mutator protein MutT
MDADERELTEIAIAVVQRYDQFLIGQRREGVPLAGLWEFPGGKIRAGETPDAAAARECREETGLDVTIVAAYPEVVHSYDHADVRLHFFAATPIDLSAQPSAPFRWVPAVKLGEYEFPAANDKLVAFLMSRSTNSQ